MKRLYHFQIGAPLKLAAEADRLRGAALKYGPHATARWIEKFGVQSKPEAIPSNAKWIEIATTYSPEKESVDTVLLRFACDDHTDVMMSVAVRTKFVCSVWRVPKWFGLNDRLPRNPRKYQPAERSAHGVCA
jgi:hypothetical protein